MAIPVPGQVSSQNLALRARFGLLTGRALVIGIKIEPGSCVGKPMDRGGLMHLTAEGHQARGCEMHQTSQGLGFSNTAAWRGLNGYYIMKKYISLFNFWEKCL